MCLVCLECVAVFNEFNIKRHYQTKHANYDKLTETERNVKLKELEVGLTSQQSLFSRIGQANENSSKASCEVAKLIAKHSKPFIDGTFVKECLRKIVENIFPRQKQEFANVCLSRNILARRTEEVSSDIKRQIETKAENLTFFDSL